MTIAGVRAQRRPVSSPAATAPSATADEQEEHGLAEHRADAQRASRRPARPARRRTPPRRAPGARPAPRPARTGAGGVVRGHGRVLRAVVASHGAEDRRGYAAGGARAAGGEPQRHDDDRRRPRRPGARTRQRAQAGGPRHPLPRARRRGRPHRPCATGSSCWSRTAATARSTRSPTGCCRAPAARPATRLEAAPRSPSSPAARPTSSPAPWACRATRWRPPRSSCARSAAGRSRLVGLGRAADDRWFTFNAGMGWDADVVAEVEQMRFRGPAATPLRYAATGLRQYYRQWRRPQADDRRGAGAARAHPVRVAFVSNTSTWTYLGSRAVHTNPGAVVRHRLGLFAMQSLGIGTVAHVAPRDPALGRRPAGPARGAPRRGCAGQGVVRDPVALQLDGDHLGRAQRGASSSPYPRLTRRCLTTTRRRPRSAVHRTPGDRTRRPESPVRSPIAAYRRSRIRARTWRNGAPR